MKKFKKIKKEVFQKPDFCIGTQFIYNGNSAIIKKIEKDEICFVMNNSDYFISKSYFEDLVREKLI